MWEIFICVLAVLRAVKTEEILIGKIVAVDNPNIKRNINNKQRSQVFATRAVSFLKQDGDLFKIHRPGLIGKDKTVSFESVRLPGFYLRQKNNRLHLDNLQSKYIKKDASFLGSKDPIGETFRLFMHNDRFLCHEPDKGFNLLFLKDSPKRDTLNCAFNIVPSTKTLQPVKSGTNGTKSPGTLNKNVKSPANSGAASTDKKPIHNANAKTKDTQKAGAVKAGAVKAGAVKAGAVKAGAVKAGAVKAGAVKADVLKPQNDGSKVISEVIAKSQETKGQPNVPIKHLNELVNDIKGNKDPFAKHKTDGLLVVSGKTKQNVVKNSNFSPGNVKNVQPLTQTKGKGTVSQAPKLNFAVKNRQLVKTPLNKKVGLAAKQRANINAYRNNQNNLFQNRVNNQLKNFQALKQSNKNSIMGSILEPVHETEQALLNSARNHWILGNPTKKVTISNPRFSNFAARRPYLRPSLARFVNPYARNFMLRNRFGYPVQVRPSQRQFVSAPSLQKFITAGVNRAQFQYIPPQQWNQVARLQQSQLNAGITQLQSHLNPGITPFQSQLNAGINPIQSQLNAGITPFQSQLNAGITPLQSQLNAGITPLQSQLNPGITPLQSQLNAGITPPLSRINDGLAPLQEHTGVASFQSQLNTRITPIQHQMNAGTAPLQEPHVYAQETHAEVSSHPAAHEDLNSYSPDNLLSTLHPELSLDHTAEHDINDITSSDTHLHHQTTVTDITHSPVSQSPDVAVAGLAVHTVSSPLDNVASVPMPDQHVPVLPSVTSVAVSPVHAVHEVNLPDYKPASGSPENLEAAHSLVHKNPDVTLEEAFTKMNPIGLQLHPIEITSEPIHIHPYSLPSDKVFNMRTHYVESKPLDMNENEATDSMKEVHVVHHNHHLVHAADENEKEKFVSTLMDVNNDLCISLVFINRLGSRYRLVSTLNPHGYRPKGARFSLKTIFKVPKKRKVMSFRAYDEIDPQRVVLLNGHKELNIYPVVCSQKPVEVTVDSPTSSKNIVIGSKKSSVHETGCQRVYGGTSSQNACCKFPFTYQGKQYRSCIPLNNEPKRLWCSLSQNFDADKKWGMCSIQELPGLNPDPHPAGIACPASCSNECGSDCPMSCCSDASSSLLH